MALDIQKITGIIFREFLVDQIALVVVQHVNGHFLGHQRVDEIGFGNFLLGTRGAAVEQCNRTDEYRCGKNIAQDQFEITLH